MKIAGVDEAGRGPLVGPVFASAVILYPDCHIEGLTDSKKLTEKKRELLFDRICHEAMAFSIAKASAEEIDAINILQASMLAMTRAVEQLEVVPDKVLVDGNRCPSISYPVEAIVKGDSKVQAISAASILAKVARDRELIELDALYPEYGFAKHKGYPTKAHLEALAEYGPIDEHRKSFGPVKKMLSSISSI